MLFVTLVILFLVALTALYVAAEFASVAVRVVRIQALAEEGNSTAQKLLPHLKDAHSLDRYVAACQIGITISSLVLGAYGKGQMTIYLKPYLSKIPGVNPDQITTLLVLFALTVFHVVLGELVPKAVALRFPEKIALALTYPMLLSLALFGWSIKVLNGSGNLILALFKVPAAGHRHVHSPEELERLVSRDAESVALDDDDRKLLTRVFRFGDHSAHAVMVPRTRVIGLNLSNDLETNLKTMEDSGHTRFPVFDGEVDKVEGYIHLKDVTRALADGQLTDLRTLIRPVTFAPSNLNVDRLFERMRTERAHLVILLDEFAGTAGIVTMEDILQEVVGEMQDEFTRRAGRILEKNESSLLVRGALLVDQLGDEVGRDLGLAPANTVGGLVMHLLGRPAAEGDKVEYLGMTLTVVEVQGNRVSRVRIEHG